MDAFPLPLPNLLLDNVIVYEMFSFMNGFSRYNQICMALEDEKQIAFYILIDTYYYTVITFGLKNAGATYQRAIQHIFADMLHEDMKDYVNDIIVKSKMCMEHCAILLCVLQ